VPDLTTTQAAELCGLTPAAFRKEMARQRQQGRDFRRPGPDARTPLWDADGLRGWLASRPGRGRWR